MLHLQALWFIVGTFVTEALSATNAQYVTRDTTVAVRNILLQLGAVVGSVVHVRSYPAVGQYHQVPPRFVITRPLDGTRVRALCCSSGYCGWPLSRVPPSGVPSWLCVAVANVSEQLLWDCLLTTSEQGVLPIQQLIVECVRASADSFAQAATTEFVRVSVWCDDGTGNGRVCR
jgi:hypothetical protein